MVRSLGLVALASLVGCGSPADVKVDAPPIDVPVDVLLIDAPALGSQMNPALSCVALRTAGKPSGVYYLQDPVTAAAFETYCDQDRGGGGWALVYRSVLEMDGTTTAFWQIPYAMRMTQKGMAMPGANFYAPTLYREGREYMDVITDLQGTSAVALNATVTGFNATTMRFTGPVKKSGDQSAFDNQFAGGWSANDYDGDLADTVNCSGFYLGVAQHYGGCWAYNLGADADTPYDDGGVGPHAQAGILTGLQLSTDGTIYSRVNEIARWARW
jgi:hypothetical protein